MSGSGPYSRDEFFGGAPTGGDQAEAARITNSVRRTTGAGDIIATHNQTGLAMSSLPKRKTVAPFPATLQSSSTQSGFSYRWVYAWEEVVVTASDCVGDTEVPSGGKSGTQTTDCAINIQEFAHGASETVIWGVDIDGADYPAGFDPNPVQNGSVVWMTEYQDDEGNLLYLFQAMGSHDGTCDA